MSEGLRGTARGEGDSAGAAWGTASPTGLLAVGCVLCLVAAARGACSYVFSQAAEALQERTSFKDGDVETTHPNKQSRWCICESDFDPIGRSGRKGVMLTDEFCDACYTASEMVAYRSRLVRNGSNFSWILGILSILLVLLAFAPLLRGCCASVHHKIYCLVGIITFVDLSINIITVSLWSNAETFKALCFQGHAFDPIRRTEVILPDNIYSDICAYSRREHNMSKSLLGLIFADMIILVTLAFMDTLREQGIIKRVLRDRKNVLSSFWSSARPAQGFDSRHRDKGSMVACSTTEGQRKTFRSRFAATRGFRAAKVALGMGRKPEDGLLSYRHDGRGRSLGRRGLINDASLLPEPAPLDIDHMQFELDDLSDISEGSDGHGLAGRRVFESLPHVRKSTHVDDIDLAMSEDSDSDTDPVLLGRRRQLPKIPSALPCIPSEISRLPVSPPTEGSRRRQLPKIPSALPCIPSETSELSVSSPTEGSRRRQLPKIPSALPFIPDEMPELPVSSQIEGRRCPGNCGFKVTWHQTHCCNLCSQSPGMHGPRCDRVPIEVS